MTIPKTIAPLFWRVIVFSGFFVVISGLSGPRIISGGLLERDGFEVYGGVGKALLFGLIAFLLLARRDDGAPPAKLLTWRPVLLSWFVPALIALGIAWMSVSRLLSGNNDWLTVLSVHGGLILSLVFVALGCFGYANVRLLGQAYRRQVLGAALIAGLFYVFLLGVYSLWQSLAAVVLGAVQGLLRLSGLDVMASSRTLILDKFDVTVAEPCSGVESIALFSGLYGIVGLLDWRRLWVARYVLVFPFALAILFGLNILRVYGLIMAGYYINPAVAFSLFHTYAGLAFFIAYSAIFWALAYGRLVKPAGGVQ